MILEFVLPDAELMLHKIKGIKQQRKILKYHIFLLFLFFKRLLSLHINCTYEYTCMHARIEFLNGI